MLSIMLKQFITLSLNMNTTFHVVSDTLMIQCLIIYDTWSLRATINKHVFMTDVCYLFLVSLLLETGRVPAFLQPLAEAG